MREQAIKTLTTKLNGDAAEAERYWKAFVKGACGGDEPSPAAFKLMAPEDALKSLSPLHRGVLACLWADAAVALAESNRATVSTEALLQAYIGDAAPQWIAGELAARGISRWG